MDLTYLPQQHGSRLSYLQALSSAILVPDPIDKELISARLRREGTTWEIRLRTAPKWIWRRCKRRVAEPEELFELLSEVFRIFGSIKDAKKGTPLFNLAAWKMVKNMLDLVVEGSISDPPETPLYYCFGFCGGRKGDLNDGVKLYRCFRGTNMLEGGVHSNLREKWPTAGVSMRTAQARLTSYAYAHNEVVSLPFPSLSLCSCETDVIA